MPRVSKLRMSSETLKSLITLRKLASIPNRTRVLRIIFHNRQNSNIPRPRNTSAVRNAKLASFLAPMLTPLLPGDPRSSNPLTREGPGARFSWGLRRVCRREEEKEHQNVNKKAGRQNLQQCLRTLQKITHTHTQHERLAAAHNLPPIRIGDGCRAAYDHLRVVLPTFCPRLIGHVCTIVVV